ncbi:MAG: PEP-CTERM sorting domain-containing protein [Xanthomonadales bacterium]|nr:PEP-CTERM sorting domain-containing protein [Xanthomonadales bacterium]
MNRTDNLPGWLAPPNCEEEIMYGKGSAMKYRLFTASAVLAMLAFVPYAHSSPVRINFSGAAGSGYVDLTLAPDPDASASYQPTFSQGDADHGTSLPLSAFDPEGAQHITGATGMFSDGTNHVAITGMIATSPGVAPPGETLPRSFSWLFADGTPHSYDNLFYADGSPLVCPPVGPTPYTFHGGFLDIFGAMFALDNGGVVGLWSDGAVPADAFGPGAPADGGVTYGLSLFAAAAGGGYTLSSSQFAGARASVPEPDFLWLFGAGILGLFAWRRSAESRRTPRES